MGTDVRRPSKLCPGGLSGDEVHLGRTSVLASQPDRQAAGPAPHLQHADTLRGHRRDVGGDAPQEGAEQDPVSHRVVDRGIPDEDASRHPAPGVRSAEVTHHGEGCGGSGRRERDHEPS
jgi:hypothetical protein